MNAHKLDALVAPTSGPAWLIDLVNGDTDSGGQLVARGGGGLSDDHRARGIRVRAACGHLVLRPRVERGEVDSLAYAFEQATNARHAPTYGRTAVL